MPKKQTTFDKDTLNNHKRTQFAKLASEAKTLENQINYLLATFEKRNNIVCHPLTGKSNSIELVISTDINAL